ncbi:23S rRNA (uracil(1939)-C(5))-methyltransferase RlmD [Serpentinimonas maccroryi]|nr:23S rRNA (uracil(1939)-C(5))-methyltransferase RlmD [Serpentinimonas maccroryi]MBA4252963.1 23S rRNA (uracil(1939)-C(5))-methyltransferase RlmD [Comamonadaceae bacterium]MCM2478457.1 23S rRNA (uracil(1939)-C(5))-methyltransferase RlmD [Serpentinimonas maccroryi]
MALALAPAAQPNPACAHDRSEPEPAPAASTSPAAGPAPVAGAPSALPVSTWLCVDAMDLDAQGVARRPDGKVVFIDGALPTEWVSAHTRRSKNQWEQADLLAIHRESALRVRPRCPHFGLHAGACGGCKMQHLEPGAQVAMKQRVLEDNLWHLAKVRPESILPPIVGPAWGYRYRARLSVRYVAKKAQVLVGFHERKSRYVADMRVCPVLAPQVSALLLPLRELFGAMDARETCPQIELAVGDALTALVLRHLQPLSAADCARLRAFALSHSTPESPIQWWLQPKGPDSVHLLDESADLPRLDYALSEFGLRMPFRPTDFTQVNPHINRVLVGRAVRLLAPQAHERVIDWFCGLGNFTLPLATQAREVLGIEGSAALVARAQSNWAENQSLRGGLAPTRFEARNLFELTPQQLCADGVADKWLVDPPREGAFALVKALADWQQAQASVANDAAAHVTVAGALDWRPPQRIVYVSCNPATLARDAGLLVHQAGYRCTAVGVVNMFAHTAHVESMAVFERVAGG